MILWYDCGKLDNSYWQLGICEGEESKEYS